MKNVKSMFIGIIFIAGMLCTLPLIGADSEILPTMLGESVSPNSDSPELTGEGSPTSLPSTRLGEEFGQTLFGGTIQIESIVRRTGETEHYFDPNDTISDGVMVLTVNPSMSPTIDSTQPSASESYVWWNWSGSISIPDGPSGEWMGVNCLEPSGIPSGSQVTKVMVHHEITHTYIGDLEVKVYNASHTWMVRDNEGGSADNINETRTEYNLFDGDNPQQEWYYRVRDTSRYDTGTLKVMQLYVYYSLPKPNLTSYKPSGWSDKIVVSNRTGTNTDDSPLYTTDTLYVDWAGINNGNAPTDVTFYSRLYVDDVLKETWSTPPEQGCVGCWFYVMDKNIGSLSEGQHSIKIVLDYDNRIDENAENDNEYTKIIYVEPPLKPNLTPYKSPTWSDKIVVSNRTETNTDDSPLYITDTLYVDWAGINNGNAPTEATFYSRLYVDDVLRATWYTPPPVNPDWWFYVTDCDIGSLSEGYHSIKIVLDYDGRIDESNENDNEYIKIIYVGVPVLPNLTPYKPPNWSDKIVVSNRTGTNTDDSPLCTTDTLYVDWAGINNGGAPTPAGFYSQLYVDDDLRGTWYTPPEQGCVGCWFYVADFPIGSLSQGSHKIKIVLDYDNRITESSDDDNYYEKIIIITRCGGSDIRIEPLTLRFRNPAVQLAVKQPVIASPDYFTFSQLDGTLFRARKFGDEIYHWMETEAGWTIAWNPASQKYEYVNVDLDGAFEFTGLVAGVDDPELAGIPKHVRETPEIVKARQTKAKERITKNAVMDIAARVPSTGTVKNLVILANFSDTSTTFSQTDFTGLFNTIGYNQHGANGSVRDYYSEVSYGNLLVTTTVSAWVTLPHSKAYYGANDENGDDIRPREMISDAIAALDATGFDFSPFDADHDGWIDSFSVIHQGPGEEAGGGDDCIWSHAWSITPVQVDGISISRYHTEPEIYSSTLTTIGVICHEFGHALGLPDLYDYGYDSEGIGEWCLMASGSWCAEGRRPAHFCSWSKIRLRWIVPTILNTLQSGVSVPRLCDNAKAYKISSGMADKEYLLIDNRQRCGFDDNLPSEGLLVYHVDDSQSNNNNQDRYMVGVLQADGLRNLENGDNRGDDGDPFPGVTNNRILGANTNPNTDSFDNGDTGIVISQISNSGNTMNFNFAPNAFTIYNDGLDTLSVTSITLKEPDVSGISWSPQAPFEIAPGQYQVVNITVNFEEAPCEETTARLLVYSNDEDKNPYPDGVNIIVSNIPCPPPNDDFVNAEIITGSTGEVTGINVNATSEPGEPDHAGKTGGNSKSVWYRWTAPSGGIATFDTQGSNFDTLLAVYTGPDVEHLLHVTSNDDSGGSRTSLVSFCVTSGTTYHIAVDGYHGASGNIVLNWSHIKECFRSSYTTYNDWLTLGKPPCWCGICGNPPWPYQCDGDADNEGQVLDYRVYNDDLTILANNWKKKITDPTLNPCADFDHKGQVAGYRVYTNDMTILSNNWKKTPSQLPGNCPRPE